MIRKSWKFRIVQANVAPGNHFDETTGVFTADADGYYFFSSNVRLDQLCCGYARLVISLNDANTYITQLHSIEGRNLPIFGSISDFWGSDKASGFVENSRCQELEPLELLCFRIFIFNFCRKSCTLCVFTSSSQLKAQHVQKRRRTDIYSEQ